MSQSVQTLLERSLPVRKLEKDVSSGLMPLTVSGTTESVRPALAEVLHEKTKRPIVVVTSSEGAAREYAQSSQDALFLPDADLNLRDVQGKSRDEEMHRLGVLKQADKAPVVYMSVAAALQPVVPKEVLLSSCTEFHKGDTVALEDVPDMLANAAYERVGTVYSHGEFAIRGEILDIFPVDSDNPIRITFFDEEIESLRYFDADTQKSIGKPFRSFALPPAREVVLTPEARAKLGRYLRSQEGPLVALGEQMADELDQFGAPGNVQTLLSILYPQTSPVAYFDNALVVFDGFEQIVQESERIAEEFEADYSHLSSEAAALPAQKNGLIPLNDLLDGHEGDVVDFTSFSDSPLASSLIVDLKISSSSGFAGRMQLLADMIRKYTAQGGHIFLFAGKKSDALARALSDFDLDVPIIQKISGEEKVAIVREQLASGFQISDTNTVAFGINDIFGRMKKKVSKKKKFGEDIFSDLKPGDIVVEETHGKGRYLGLSTMKVGDSVGEYMEIEYRDGDKLFIPAASVETVEKYIGSGEGDVILSKLGGQEWERAKTKARESTKKLAFDMMKLYSSRYNGKGHAFGKDTVWQQEFEDAFAYEETDGQIQSVEEIKKDMESPRMMDRLLLGDVGYGKTEVAMRAAFKAVMDGKQVAVLVPTTLLARQHLKTFQERFKNFPVNIAGISRFSKGTHKQTLKDLEIGKTDIIIGTHRLLSKDVHFNDLGLVIVDEEQRFGVNHKERLKTLKSQVDVLTLSATPIPRTLEMSLTGIRDMSTIETPPAMKKEPYTYVTRYTEGLLHDAVARELRRGGQVFVVCRQIRQMDKVIEDVRRAAPKARICAAHGQMAGKEIEDVISGFIDGEHDVLVCTTIIENGIDIPNVNTIIVYESDMFGLSQLYQLKGRVGRSDRTSYAYFTYNPERNLNEDAARRLQAIREFTELGSGFKVAMRDLQIRGAGNLLGAEQSGHMASVGYAMYCRMMSEAVEEARGNPVEEEIETTVDLGIPCFIPESYISSQADKMDIYRLIAKIRSIADAKNVIAEMRDRYGKLPKEVDNLIVAAVIRCYASRAGFASVIRKKDQIELRYAESYSPDIKKLLKVTSDNSDRVILKPLEPPVLAYKTKSAPGKKFLEFVASLGTPVSRPEKHASEHAS